MRTGLYKKRFPDQKSREGIWRVLASYFQRFVQENSTVLDIGAGRCELINNIKASKKIAIDANPDIMQYAAPEVKTIVTENLSSVPVKSDSVDVVFQSNLFEHLKKENIEHCLGEIRRILKHNGLIINLNPNMRYCVKDFWQFWDHITPMDDRAFAELLETMGFEIVMHKPKFLPYTTKSALPLSPLLAGIYVNLPLVKGVFGKQFLVVAGVKK